MGGHFKTDIDQLAAFTKDLNSAHDSLEQVRTALLAGPEDPRIKIKTIAFLYVRFAATNRGMFELMFRHDLLSSGGELGLRDASLPLFRLLTELVAAVRPDRPAEVTAAAIWAGLHGTAELGNWGSLALATGATGPDPFIDATLTAHLGPEGPP